ncbi:gem-associated protein 8 [Spea bombifrons]|uniref:gem-associated protein 8 n=1 Tax=Spea bombifrons TaxID=233779 RepID=UPI0023493DF4|nr:gem-associated protein 8 [Spea bombifrons]XP_053310994.1 gem-associated protein 8 [Spea bombifrons]XP_053310995.1 gem-associated protein 8 [Spea bombifrons]XP_053310996.1 gem-associated protein 8 [Spea bombifrons]XP_053310997.1 gem-associated protein 8 [Spea bombifrons]XP_053310998.1 gem-associated protein 8 [Spea bombifrons]XP_053310999.1 gem-associated protein 8 [Spea bombifrons]XP_053311001.1 gem-associated protein 8 [Spea bombifrons]XP_053311002.1 gem-associated protein 8 [Spea bombi
MAGRTRQETEPWYAGQMYSRYWKHYSQAMHWLYKHKRAYRMAVASLCPPPWYPVDTFQNPRYADWEGREQSYRDIYPQPHKPATQPRRARPLLKVSESKEKESEMECEEEGTDSEEEEIECDVSNMEITEELRQYFAETERHREELKKQQQLEAEIHGQYVEADHDLHVSTGRSSQPPSERPGERRRAEMKKLYGEDAAKIQGMETAMQLSFDRHCDKKQPKYWPIIPLKL